MFGHCAMGYDRTIKHEASGCKAGVHKTIHPRNKGMFGISVSQTTSIKSLADLFHCFDELAISYKNHEHEPAFTVQDSQRIKHNIPGVHTKNLLLKVKKKPKFFLIHMIGDDQLHLKSLAKIMATSTLSFATEDQLFNLLKLRPGHVTPFGLINFDSSCYRDEPKFAFDVIVDVDLFAYEFVNFHPLQNNMTTTIQRDDFRRFLEYTKIPYSILKLPKLETNLNSSAT